MSRCVDRRVQIVADLLRKWESSPSPGELNAADSRNEENVEEILTTAKLAERVKLSRAHLCDLFRRDLKTTPKQLAKRVKMENAIWLAEDTNLPIERIVELVEGGDPSHFQRDVKKTFGTTLGEFRSLQIQLQEARRARRVSRGDDDMY